MADTDSPRGWVGVMGAFWQTLEEQVLSEGGRIEDIQLLAKERLKPGVRQLARDLIVQSGRIDWFSLHGNPSSILGLIEEGGYHRRLTLARQPDEISRIPIAVHPVNGHFGFRRLVLEFTVENLCKGCQPADLVEFLELGRSLPCILREHLPAETFFIDRLHGFWVVRVIGTTVGHLELCIDRIRPNTLLATGFNLLVHQPGETNE